MSEPIHILLVEDSPIAARMVYVLLEPLGCQIDLVEDGGPAVELFTKNRYDLVLMDIGLPTMDGFEATKHMRADEQGKRATPIIGVTAHTEPVFKQKALNSGMNACYSKPLTLSIAKSILKDYLHVEK